MIYNVLIVLFLCHFIGDFLLQSNKMALNKSSSNKYLAAHAFCYCLPFLLFWKFPLILGILFVSHFIIDYMTSRINRKLYALENKHWFYVGVGGDQYTHSLVLILCCWIFFK